MWTLPNILTISRIAATPVFILLFFVSEDGTRPTYTHSWAAWSCLALYVIAAATDYFDGFLARRWKQVSPVGIFLDPISDKILVATLLVLLVGFGRLPDLWMIPAIVIMVREFLIAGLREFLGPADIRLPVSALAKWKTAIQMIAIGFLVIGPYGEEILPYTLAIGRWGLALAAVLTVTTGWSYMKAGFTHIRTMDQKQSS